MLTAASLTAQAPAVDVTAQDRLTSHEIYVRLHPEPPRMSSPPLAALTPPSSLAEAVKDSQFVATVGSDDTDRAWSEYNHHWAGMNCAHRGAAGAAQPASHDALGALLAA